MTPYDPEEMQAEEKGQGEDLRKQESDGDGMGGGGVPAGYVDGGFSGTTTVAESSGGGTSGGGGGGVPDGYVDGGFSGTTVVNESSGTSEQASSATNTEPAATDSATAPPTGETTPVDPNDDNDDITYINANGKPDIHVWLLEGMSTGQADGESRREACKAAIDACKRDSGCPGKATSDKTCTCWLGGTQTYTCLNECRCPDLPVA
jgi:hypothetical protein